jgi:hypothetical protein
MDWSSTRVGVKIGFFMKKLKFLMHTYELGTKYEKRRVFVVIGHKFI